MLSGIVLELCAYIGLADKVLWNSAYEWILESLLKLCTGIVTGIVLEFCTTTVTAIDLTIVCSCASEKHCNPTVL